MATDKEPPGERSTKDEPPGRLTELKLLGGRLCLDFINTVDPRVGDQPRDYLRRYVDLVRWGQHAGMLSADSVREMEEAAALEPKAAERALRRAVDLRETLYRAFAATASNTAPEPDDLRSINETWVEAVAHARVAPEGNGFAWCWARDVDALDAAWWPIARSAVELLTSPDLHRVRQCPGSNCGWLFLDASRKGNRRWCSMEGCGNRAKARRHYALKLTQSGASA
jgi:predicted RNA-binding Zn ribbon-like protein